MPHTRTPTAGRTGQDRATRRSSPVDALGTALSGRNVTRQEDEWVGAPLAGLQVAAGVGGSTRYKFFRILEGSVGRRAGSWDEDN